MTAEELAVWLQERTTNTGVWFSPIWTNHTQSNFEITMPDGTEATVTITEGHR